MKEHLHYCPHCGSESAMLLDASKDSHHYFEDCEMCGNPMEVDLALVQGEVIQYEAVTVE